MADLKSHLAKVALGRPLSFDEARDAFDIMMSGDATPSQIGGFLMALRVRGETVDEISGAVATMRDKMFRVSAPANAIDIVGTGGDGSGSYNVSTCAAFIAAGCGVPVAKHGNRALSSKSGAADTLAALGVDIEIGPDRISECIRTAGLGFMFAPAHHSAMRHVGPSRVELGTRTIFNLLGPLTNPAAVRHQVVGVYDRRWCEHIAAALGALGCRRAAVVHGDGGLDELEVRGHTHVAIYDEGGEADFARPSRGVVTAYTLAPKQFGIGDIDPAGLAGGNATYNAGAMRDVLAGRHVGKGERLEAFLQASAMTAALGLELLEPGVLDLDRLPDQYIRARTVAVDGAAHATLVKWQQASAHP